MGTIKTTVYLDEGDKRRLGELAARSGRSEADLLRQGVRLVLEREAPRPSLGYATSSDGCSAAEADALLAELGFGGV